MLGVLMCYIMAQAFLIDGIRRAQQEEETQEATVISLDEVAKDQAV